MVKKGTQKHKNIKRSSLKRRIVQQGGESVSFHNLTKGSKTRQTTADQEKTPQMTTLIKKTRKESSITDPPSPIDSSLNETGDSTASTDGPGSSKENPLLIKPGKPFFIELDGAKYMITPE